MSINHSKVSLWYWLHVLTVIKKAKCISLILPVEIILLLLPLEVPSSGTNSYFGGNETKLVPIPEGWKYDGKSVLMM